MSFPAIFLVAVGLGMDAFSVALGVGFASQRVIPGQLFRLASGFGLFQFVMPLLGWAAGRTIAELIAAYDHWAAFGLLTGVGIKMIADALRDEEGESSGPADPTTGLSLFILSVATSIDAFAVGLSFALLEMDIVNASIVIGVAAFAMTSAGIFLGAHAGRRIGKKAGVLGGVILIGIGLKILLGDLL